MALRTKFVAIAIGSVFATAAAGLLIQRTVIRKQGEGMIRDAMRATILSAENTRRSVSLMRNSHMFNETLLKADAAKVSDYKKALLYQTVPVVAAWNSITEVAKAEGYQFRVPAQNPRNAKNAPDPDEARILTALEKDKLADYFEVNEKKNEEVYARPIILSEDCLVCHGDSTRKDGKDMLGFRMEGWKTGDRHGMFLLRSDLSRVDKVVQASMMQTLLWLTPLSVAIGFGVFFLIARISRDLLVPVQSMAEGADQVKSAAAQMSESSQSLAQGSSEQAASLQEISATTEQITARTKGNAAHARAAAEEMEHVNRCVQDGNIAVKEMVASMGEIKASSANIAKIIKVIDEIAFQTNILALNAAVEAARAGTAGAGFAVVADEVRNLAQRSAVAAKDTAPLIEESIAKSQAGGARLGQVAEVIRAITESAAKVKSLVDEVNLGSEEQARGIEQVSRTIVQMNTVTQSGAASAEESAAAGEELSAQAATMDELARRLRVIVEG